MLLADDSSTEPSDHELNIPFCQFAIRRWHCGGYDTKQNPWMSCGKPLDCGQDRTSRHCLGASDRQFSGRRIGEEPNVLDALFELVERRYAALYDSKPIRRRLNASREAFKKRHAQSLFKD